MLTTRGSFVDAPPSWRQSRALAPTAPEEPAYPPERQVQRLWEAARPLSCDPEVYRWASDLRGFDPDVLDDLGLVRALPKGQLCPEWAKYAGRFWTASGHRALIGMYDSTGQMRSISARTTFERAKTEGHAPKKALLPRGYRVQRLCFADARMLHLLRSCQVGDSDEVSLPKRALIVEGGPDFLTWAQRLRQVPPNDYAILGVINGTWCRGYTDAMTTLEQVVIRTHRDDDGRKYGDDIERVLVRAGVKVLRSEAGACA
jgi:hypothetical protein